MIIGSGVGVLCDVLRLSPKISFAEEPSMKSNRHVLAGLILLAASGCTSYYQVTDPTNGKTYYTTKLESHDSGSTTFTDARTGEDVTLQNTQVAKITEQQFDNGKNGVSASPTPAPQH
jgi:hypothetical protein